MTTAREYVKSGEHLPPWLKDFHDAKLFFKWLVWEKLETQRKEWAEQRDSISPMTLEGINFANAQVFTIDYFLWFVGMFGYKLQKVRKKDVQFYDIDTSMAEYNEELGQKFADMLNAHLASAGRGDADQS